MKITILSVASQFIHGALAPWYLKSALGGGDDITVFETSINEPAEQVLARVFDTHPQVLCVPCYIWNIRFISEVCRNLKAAIPECKILLGGPEVSFRAREFMAQNPWADAVLCGEGEQVLPRVIENLSDMSGIDSVVFRRGDEICGNDDYAIVDDLSTVPSPYTEEMLRSLDGRLAYYESSRGCPFSCAYCLSSAVRGVRNFPIERVKKELKLITRYNVRTVKMADRTFNANPTRAAELLRFILSDTGDVCFHLEVGADLFTDEIIELLLTAPAGKIRLEVGVQSTNPNVLERVSRKTDLEKLADNLIKIMGGGNICVHADLIFGLPGEDMASCRKSFNDLFALRPHELQLGFLKLLRGSSLEKSVELCACVFSSDAPYCVIRTDKLTAQELFALHGFEDVFEKYYNSGRFHGTVEYLLGFFPSAFDLFSSLAEYTDKAGLKYARLSATRLYEILYDFAKAHTAADSKQVSELLLIDYYSSVFTGKPPEFMQPECGNNFRDKCFKYLQSLDIPAFFPHYGDISPKALYKLIRFVPANSGAYLFDPSLRSPVTGLIRVK